ncbi:MAG TPA: polymer-forming cytoskeletal protein, partial [Labilithrix sp.]|nr:polymer-forming cytoskeletal protein [Labilithrix sp.]
MTSSTVISRTTFVRGRVSGEGDLEIAGRVEGEVSCTGDLLIEASGLIAANLSGSRVVVRGAVKGDIVAEQVLVIEAGARVVGDLRAPRIAIAPGGLVRGHVQTAGAM